MNKKFSSENFLKTDQTKLALKHSSFAVQIQIQQQFE